ncbi:MAG: UbiD family decarboxylase [Oscillospiraceae bacterium]
MKPEIYDLRSAIDALRRIPGQLQETDRLVDTDAEIAGIYRHIGARGTLRRPTKIGPMMLFHHIQGFPEARIAIGVLSSRERVGYLLGTEPEKLGKFYVDALKKPVAPVVIPNEQALCQEEVYLASDPDFDLRKLVPGTKNTEVDAGPYITMGLCYAHDPEDPDVANATIHRMCIQNRDEMTIGFGGYRHIGVFKDKAFRKEQPLPISVSIGLDPAVYLASCFEPPTTPLGFDELTIAGAMRGKPVELTRCRAVNEYCIANAEIVIEGELIPGKMLPEDSATHTGHGLPEFHGYAGNARKQPVIKVKAVTCRHKPIFQMCIGASEEHVNMAGIPTEAAMLMQLEKAMPGKALNAYCPPSGGGKLNGILQFKKSSPQDEGKQRQAAILALGAAPEMKNIFIVDEDVDIFDPYDVEWAMTTRFRPDKDLIVIPGVRCHIGDPTQKKFYDPNLLENGLAHKAIYDCTVPFSLKENFERAHYQDVDISDLL